MIRIACAALIFTTVALSSTVLPGKALAQQKAYKLETIADGINHPWRIAFLPENRMLVTSRAAKLWLIDERGAKQEVSGLPPVYVAGQGGLFEAVPHPDFSSNNFVYLVYAHGTGRANGTRVARAKLDGNVLRDVQVVFTVDPLKDTSAHFGGRLVFMPDGTFVLSTGDGFVYREKSQDLKSLLGKIVRLNADGSIPKDNPFVSRQGAKPEIWSYGHRNPQGLFYDALSNRLYENEHGAKGGDEINVIEPGKNYGWPVITNGLDYSGAKITPYKTYAGMEQPFVDWTPSIAPSSLIVYQGDMFPQWKGNLLSTSLVTQELRRVRLQDGKPVQQESLFKEIGERLRDVREGPDGAIYIATDARNGKIIKITPR